MIESVIKRDGTLEDFNADKINSMATWAVEAAPSVPWSDIVMDAVRLLGKKVVTAQEIQESLIKVCIEREDYKHNKVAGRLVLGSLRKSSFALPNFKDHYYSMVEDGYYRDMAYTSNELETLSEIVSENQDRDLLYGYPTLRQYNDKYATKDEEGNLLELPQYTYMAVAMSMMESGTLEDVVMYYHKASLQKINIPSPVLSQQRTESNTGVSCVISTAGDSLGGIEATKHVAFMATASSAGLGVEYDVRSPRDPVRKGYAKAGGKLPHYRVLDKITDEVKQSNRGGSATVSFNVLDPEIETLLNLKLKRSPETKRIDQLDYSLVWNNEFLKSAATRQDWNLYSKKMSPEVHESFYSGNLTQLADNESRSVKALDILKQYTNNRLETGRLYWKNVDNANAHTPWKEDVIRQSNLCMEIMLPTKEYDSVADLYKTTYKAGDGVTAQCFLSAIDLARITDDNDYEETAYIILKSLDNLIETMSYPLPQMEVTAKYFRSVGVGLTNLAYHLAKEDKKFDDVEYLHYLAERHYYFLMKASIRIAKERGKFSHYDKTRWADGWTPLETYKSNVDSLVTNGSLRYDWSALQSDSLVHGVRFSTLVAHMPCESSSVMGNGTNGLYPIRHDVVYKDSKGGLVQFFAPEVDELEYENAYSLNPYTLIDMYAIFQKWNDQGISADTYEDLSKGNGKVSTTELIKRILYANKMGMKTWYYNNTKTGRGESKVLETESGCTSCSL